VICSNIIRDVLDKKRKLIVLDGLVQHFMKNDLLHYIIDIFGYKNLSDEEKLWIKAFLNE